MMSIFSRCKVVPLSLDYVCSVVHDGVTAGNIYDIIIFYVLCYLPKCGKIF